MIITLILSLFKKRLFILPGIKKIDNYYHLCIVILNYKEKFWKK